MVRTLFVFCLVILVCYGANAQSNTLESTENQPDIEGFELPEISNNKVMIIPYEGTMYRSDVEKDMIKQSGLNSWELRNQLRSGLCNNVFIGVKDAKDKSYSPIAMAGQDEESAKDLRYIYQSIGYKYSPIPVKDKAVKDSKSQKFFKNMAAWFKGEDGVKGKKEETNGTRIENGQLITEQSKQERFMDTKIHNDKMLPYLAAKYETGLFVFINELDIELAPGNDWRDLQAEQYKRQIKVHYTIIKHTGEKVYGGAAKVWFTSDMNDPKKIAANHFSRISKQICGELPPVEQIITNKDESKIAEKKSAKQHSTYSSE